MFLFRENTYKLILILNSEQILYILAELYIKQILYIYISVKYRSSHSPKNCIFNLVLIHIYI